MVQVWEDLRLDLTREGAKPVVDLGAPGQGGQPDRVSSEVDARNSPFGRISRAFWGDFTHLSHEEGGWLPGRIESPQGVGAQRAGGAHRPQDRRAWSAITRRSTSRPSPRTAPRRRPGPSSTTRRRRPRPRRYESAARRGFFKAIEEYRAAEADPRLPESASGTNPRSRARRLAARWLRLATRRVTSRIRGCRCRGWSCPRYRPRPRRPPGRGPNPG